MIERTISGMMGKGSVNHNIRKFTATNVDKSRTVNNIIYCNDNIKEVYKDLFGEALTCYNEKQIRADRKIDNYYEKIRTGKQEKLFYEAIFQIGNKDDMNAKSYNGEIAMWILDGFMSGFAKRNPNLRVFSAVLHMDEETPHLHIDFIPYISDSKRGLDTRVSLKGALEKMGFKGGRRGETEWNQWMESEKQELAKEMLKHDVYWKQLGTKNKHLSVLDFEKQERQKEVDDLVENLEGLIDHKYKYIEDVNQLEEENAILKESKKSLKDEINDLESERDGLVKSKQLMEKEYKVIQKEFSKLNEAQKYLNRSISGFNSIMWQLPEPVKFENAKSYKENKAQPLINRFVDIIQSLILECKKWKDKANELTESVKRGEAWMGKYLAVVRERDNTKDNLREKEKDLDRLKRIIGAEKFAELIEQAKELELAEQSIHFNTQIASGRAR